MIIKRFILGEYESNCYVVSSKGEAIVIDPGYENNVVIPYLHKEGLNLKYVFLTHGHFDHIGGVNQLKEAFPNAVVMINHSDLIWLEDNDYNLTKEKVYIDKSFKNTITLEVGNLIFETILTPGHSAGGTALKSGNHLFVGDTLFKMSIGRYDFPFGDYNTLINSIKKLYLLPDDTKVYPGHGEVTTIGFEKKYNYFVKS